MILKMSDIPPLGAGEICPGKLKGSKVAAKSLKASKKPNKFGKLCFKTYACLSLAYCKIGKKGKKSTVSVCIVNKRKKLSTK